MPKYRLISADSHVNEPPDLWVTRVDKKYRERAPQLVTPLLGLFTSSAQLSPAQVTTIFQQAGIMNPPTSLVYAVSAAQAVAPNAPATAEGWKPRL